MHINGAFGRFTAVMVFIEFRTVRTIPGPASRNEVSTCARISTVFHWPSAPESACGGAPASIILMEVELLRIVLGVV